MYKYAEVANSRVNHAEVAKVKDVILSLTFSNHLSKKIDAEALSLNKLIGSVHNVSEVLVDKFKKCKKLIITLKKQRSTRDADISAANPPVTGAS